MTKDAKPSRQTDTILGLGSSSRELKAHETRSRPATSVRLSIELHAWLVGLQKSLQTQHKFVLCQIFINVRAKIVDWIKSVLTLRLHDGPCYTAVALLLRAWYNLRARDRCHSQRL